jgi:hypothetical protein
MAKRKKIKGNVLADGEVTGHRHVAEGAGTAVFEVAENERELIAPKGATIKHEEHGAVKVDGDRRVGQVLEYDPLTEALRPVQD